MARPRPFKWQSLVPLCLFVTCVLAQLSCTCAPASPAKSTITIVECVMQDDSLPIASSLQSEITVAGTVPVEFDTTTGGDSVMRVRFASVPGRGPEPELNLSLSAAGGNGVAGVGASLNAATAIERCPKTIAMDGEIRPVMFDEYDALCFDHARMVVVAKNEATIEYRTFPDAQVRIVAFMGDDGPDYFEAFFSSGNKLELGKMPATNGRYGKTPAADSPRRRSRCCRNGRFSRMRKVNALEEIDASNERNEATAFDHAARADGGHWLGMDDGCMHRQDRRSRFEWVDRDEHVRVSRSGR